MVAGPKGAGRILQVSDLRTVAAFSAPPASVLVGAGAGYSGDRVAAMSGPAGKAGAVLANAAETSEPRTGRSLAVMRVPESGALFTDAAFD